MFNLFACCLFSYVLQIATAGYGHATMSNTSPVRVGDTATFTCIFHPGSVFVPKRSVNWYRYEDSLPLGLNIDNGTTCEVNFTPPSLKSYTLAYTCDTEHRRYTLSIVNVTESDIHRHPGWCCDVDGFPMICAEITEAQTTEATSVAPTNRTEVSRIPEVIESSTMTARGTTSEPPRQLWILLFRFFV